MGIKVCKFGGTSMADAKAIRQVESIVRADKDRRYVVVSAPGKRFKDDIKITDLLYKCYREALETGKCAEYFAPVRERFKEIAADLGLKFDIDAVLDETEYAIAANTESADFAASRGEYLSARIAAELLGYKFVDATEIIRFDSRGNLNQAYTEDKIKTVLDGVEYAVIPGFYGKNSYGKIKTFSRGGSDITGSIVAGGVDADLYENWTDVSGFMVCDPRIVPQTKIIDCITYKELRELSYMGASVRHAEAIFPVLTKRVSIHFGNTFEPSAPGTMIVSTEKYNHLGTNVITGIAGKKDFTVIFLEKSLMNAEVGFIRKILSIVEHHGICVEHVPSGIDTLSIIIESHYLKNGVLSDLVNEIRESVAPDYIHVTENVSLVATVGHGMARKAGVASRLFTALAKSNINIQMIDQGSSELNIIVGVANTDYEKCISAIYDEFFS